MSGRCGAWQCEEHTYLDGDPVPLGYRVERSQSDGAATVRFAGLLFLVGGYAPAYIGALAMPSEYGALYIPLAGPWITIGVVETTPDKVFLAIDGAAQAAGAVLLVGGMVGAGKHLLRTQVGGIGLHVAPSVRRDHYSVHLSGLF